MFLNLIFPYFLIMNKEKLKKFHRQVFIVSYPLNDQEKDRKRISLIKYFNHVVLNVDMQTNFKDLDFLKVTLDLKKLSCRPYRKANNSVLIHLLSNHLSKIIKQLPIINGSSLKDYQKVILTKKFLI